jgi:glyoxylase-like metal-dependent hydrolase (beta-lactamase superfamily II)
VARARPARPGRAALALTEIRDVAPGLWIWRQPHPDWGDDLPESELEPLFPDGMELPGGIRTLYDGRSRDETPVWLPEQRAALVFADALTAPRGELRVWRTPWHEQAVLPALRALLELPFELVIVAHGDPVHDRAAFERALELPPGP